ncbi:MAG: molybdopterin-dependent oxidoreductase, partial [Betaproteobacteria bacterium]|nr:molybdopterin-dependent oxidoreductase [Betaproteobacteria bacterium]
MATKVIPSTCSECLVRCGSLVHVEDDRVVKITGNPAHPSSHGAFCIKGMNGPISNRENPARITYPMRRVGQRGEGRWERISWDDAFEQIAERLGEIKAARGPRSIAGATPTHTQSRGVAMRLLLRSLGSPNFMINQDLCHGCRATAALLTGLGGI